MAGNNGNKIQMWYVVRIRFSEKTQDYSSDCARQNADHNRLDGESVFSKTGLDLWTGETYPKFGIYRGEKGDHDADGESNVFDLWVYRVQISDANLDEVSAASGIGGIADNGTASGGPKATA